MNLKLQAKLDQGFQPMVLVFKDFEMRAKAAGGEKLVIGIERNNGLISTFEMTVFPDGTGHDEENIGLVERIVKTLLWVKGGYKVIIAGSEVIGNKIKAAYDFGGLREFDRGFMARGFIGVLQKI